VKVGNLCLSLAGTCREGANHDNEIWTSWLNVHASFLGHAINFMSTALLENQLSTICRQRVTVVPTDSFISTYHLTRFPSSSRMHLYHWSQQHLAHDRTTDVCRNCRIILGEYLFSNRVVHLVSRDVDRESMKTGNRVVITNSRL
jgi:hypothetical protein